MKPSSKTNIQSFSSQNQLLLSTSGTKLPKVSVNSNQKQNKITKDQFKNSLKLQLSPRNDLQELKQLLHSINSNKSNSFHPIKDLMQKQVQNQNSNQMNKLSTCNQDNSQDIITQMISADNKYKIISRSLRKKQLQTATIQQLSQNQKEKKKVLPLLVAPKAKLINYQDTKSASKSIGIISSYAANTNQGISRNYNEDRVSIILNITKSNVKCSLFAIYDGHGGHTCCDYLRDTLHQNIINNSKFPQSPKDAILLGVKKTEEKFLEYVNQMFDKQKKLDKSGSCAIVVLVIASQCYIINIGDSRAIMSVDNGKYTYNLSRDHKPTQIHQQKRIQDNGGKIYRTQMRSLTSSEIIYGPLRVYPGKLSVSRTFGDIEAKSQRFGGNSKVVAAIPQIKHFQIKSNQDFIILGSDGIFDKLESQQIIQIVWLVVEQNKNKQLTIHQLCALCVEEVLREVMNRRSLDNLTLVMIAFKSFEIRIKNIQQISNKQAGTDVIKTEQGKKNK